MFQKLRPLGDRVLVKRLANQEKTVSGIYIPDAAKPKSQTGVIVAVGAGRIHENKVLPLSVKVDDIIYFGQYAGTEAGEDHIIIREDDILGVVEQ